MSRIFFSFQIVTLISLLSGAVASAQQSSSPATGLTSGSVIGPSAFFGAWEGYDSEGVWLHLTFRADGEAGPDVVALGAASRTPSAELITTEARYHVGPLSPQVASLDPLSGSGTIMVTFYSSEGMRWNWPSGRQAVLTRTLSVLPDMPPASAYQMSFSAPIQARLLSLSGDWYALTPESALGRAFRFTVIDLATGTLAIRESRPEGPSLSAAEVRSAHMTRAQQEHMSLMFDDTGDELTLIWTSESEVSLVEGDSDDETHLGRTPPERP